MQTLFSENTGYIIERLQAKLKFQAQEISHYQFQIEHLTSKNRKNLEQLIHHASSAKSFHSNCDQSTQDGPIEGPKVQAQVIEGLADEILELEVLLSEEQKIRTQAQAEALLNKQVLIEEQMLLRQISSGYEEKIMELRRLLQDKENLLETKLNKELPSKDELLEKKLRRDFIKAEEPLILKKIIESLQERVAKEKDAKEEFEKQLKQLQIKYEHADQIFQRKFNRSIDDSFMTKSSSEDQQLILFDDQAETLSNSSQGSPKNKTQQYNKNSSETIHNNQQVQVCKKDCCRDLRLVLAKISISEKQLKDQIHRLKHHVLQVSSSYNILVKANLEKDQKIQTLSTQIQCYKNIIRNNKCLFEKQNENHFHKVMNHQDLKIYKEQSNQFSRNMANRFCRRVFQKDIVSFSLDHTSPNKVARRKLQTKSPAQKKGSFEPFMLQFSSVNISDVDVSRSYFRDLQQI